ncbi:MAG: type VI secretion system baseplate subunit TssE [Syntrophorhabdaceae bacterium]|nr:type VI secretion system baseplate subunit TssE [Syntrophorhabdaceae bacterium]
MYEERLIERIRNLEVSSERKTRDIPYIIDSILRHLQRLLNTRRGSVPIADDYGMPDFTSFEGTNLNEQAKEVAANIKNMILKYEPRLGKIQIIFIPDSDDMLSLKFKLQAEIIHVRDQVIPVEFETIISSDGRVKVSE